MGNKINYKYTSDGKKVVVVGKLNSVEYIVQEIFMDGENEIPSGEHFVVKSLHDTKLVSWHEKQTKEAEERYKRLIKEYETEENKLINTKKVRLKALEEQIRQLSYMKETIGEATFERLSDFILEKNKYAIFGEWTPQIIEFDLLDCLTSADTYHGQRSFDGLKLMSFYGTSKGDLSFGLNRYSDGSGSSTTIHLFKTLDEAKEKYLEVMRSKEYHTEIIKEHQKWNIPLDKDKLKKYMDKRKEGLTKSMDDYMKKYKEFESDLEKLNNGFID